MSRAGSFYIKAKHIYFFNFRYQSCYRIFMLLVLFPLYFQAKPLHIERKLRLYSPTSMVKAYSMVKDEGVPVLKAARTYGVPETTLRDRVMGRVDPETGMGSVPLFSQLEEVQMVNHVRTMADFGYGYTRQECVDLATDFAVQLGKRESDKPLSMKWMKGFLSRWPEIRVLKPRGLEHVRAKMTSEAVVSDYFKNLEDCMTKYDLLDKPHLIFNMDEKGISVNHKPPCVVASSDHCPPAVTSGKGKNVTLLGCGSASGASIPPYFVFPGKRMLPELLDGATGGANGTVSETGWSNSAVFRTYLETHFVKFMPGRGDQKVLLLLDGHKSHVSIGLADWAKEHNIILFILPAHTSHLLQPMDVACYGPFERIYNFQCHKLMRETHEIITRNNVCKIACNVYAKALCPENLMSAFKKTGIYPLDKEAIAKEYIIPSEVFRTAEDVAPQVDTADKDKEANAEKEVAEEPSMFQAREQHLKQVKSEIVKKPRKSVSKIVAGKEITDETVYGALLSHEKEQGLNKQNSSSTCEPVCKKPRKTATRKYKVSSDISPVPGPSHINLVPDSSDSEDSDVSEEEKCCVCGLWTPKELSRSASIIFTKWVKCDGITHGKPCQHWTHLTYCTNVRVIRRGDKFYCPHCVEE